MMRVLLALLLTGAAFWVFAPLVTISTNPDALFPDTQIDIDSLDDSAGREVVLTLRHENLAFRNEVARRLAVKLTDDPFVEMVSLAASAPSEEFQTWVWENRFQLAAPEETDFDTGNMAFRLEQAMDYFANINSLLLGDRFLLDPTGSYWRLVQGLQERSAEVFTEQEGVWQSHDQSAAVLHLRLADRVFDVAEMQAWAASVREAVASEGVTPHMIGVRVITAETTAFNVNASTRASIIAAVLLLCWLTWSLRSPSAALFAFLPVAIGLVTAFVVVALVFGSVHIIAIAFGGVLVGLALDYPIHVMAHRDHNRRRAYRLIFLGALTTGISFLAMIGSQVPALVQAGVFVLVGLTISAVFAILLPSPVSARLRGFSLNWFAFRIPAKARVEYLLAGIGLFSVLVFNNEVSVSLFEPPQHVRSEIEKMAGILNLPSSKLAVEVRGETLADLLRNEEQLSRELDGEIEKGGLQSYEMLAQILPSSTSYFAKSDVFRANAREALVQLGMSPQFSKQQLEAYEAALQVPSLRQEDLTRFPEIAGQVKRLRIDAEGWSERVELTFPSDVQSLNFPITSPHAKMIDLLMPIRASMTALQVKVSSWLLVGLICGTGVLALGLQSISQAGRILRTSCAVLGATATLLILLHGSLSLLHIVAMALVVGIGVDYAIILSGAKNEKDRANTSATSVFVCAVSTLIAFIVLAFSGVQILHQIGLSVVIGLPLMLLLTLADSGETEE